MKKIFTAIVLGTLLLVSCKPITGPKGYAIVFGIAEYDSNVSAATYPNLTWTHDDAVSIASLLETQGWTVPPPFLDGNATKAQLQASIENLANTELPVLFYYSGHGGNIDGQFYICTFGSLKSGMDNDYSLMITPNELNSLFSNNNIKHGIVILDSCRSGGFVSPDGTVSGVPDNIYSGTFTPAASLAIPALETYVNYAQSNNVIVLSAAGAQEDSIETLTLGHGIFTYYLLKSAQYGDYDDDGFVSTVEAYAYAANALDKNYNDPNYSRSYLPRFSGEPRDYLLFKTIK